MLEQGQTFRLDLDSAKGDKNRVQLPHPEIIEASEVGHSLLVDDGKVKLVVSAKGEDYLECKVEVPGRIKDRKGVNTPDSVLKLSPLTKKDRSDLDFMLHDGRIDIIALSFVQVSSATRRSLECSQIRLWLTKFSFQITDAFRYCRNQRID